MKILTEKKEMTISGMLLAFWKGAASPITIIIENEQCLPIYSEKEKLETSMKDLKIEEYDIKQIDNGAEFLESVIPHFRVVLNPYITPEGNTRFTNIQPIKDDNEKK